jgi:PmbA protein
MTRPIDLAADVVRRCQALGAAEVTAAVAEGRSVSVTRRDRKVEEATEATTRRLSVALLVEDRYSSHSTSDLRPEALSAFLERAVAASRLLEPDADHRLPELALCGRSRTDAALETTDPEVVALSSEDRAARVAAIEEAVLARAGDDFVSGTAWISDGSSRAAEVTSHGFADETSGAWLSVGASVTLAEPGRRPEGSVGYAARFLGDLPDAERLAAEAFERADENVGAGPIASGTYPMLLDARVAGRILGLLAGPMNGALIHEGRSCLADKLDQPIGSRWLDLADDPWIPRGLGSQPWDDDLLRTQPRRVVENGTLRLHYIDVFHGRRLGRAPTTGGRSNWVLTPGTQSPRALAAAAPRAILVTGFLGGNANPTTGDFSFGIRGRLLENGEPTAKLSEMNVSGNTLRIFHQLAGVANDVWAWSTTRSPSLWFEDVSFSGT